MRLDLLENGNSTQAAVKPLDGPALSWAELRLSESQHNPVSASGVNSAMTQVVGILRKIKRDLKS